MDGRAACRAATLVLSGAAAATAALLLLSVLRPDLWQFRPVTSDFVLSNPHRLPFLQGGRGSAADAAAAASAPQQPARPPPQPSYLRGASAPVKSSAAPDLLAAAPEAEQAVASDPAPAPQDELPTGAAEPAPPAVLAADLADAIGVHPTRNKFNALLIADLTEAAAEARAPVQQDAACVKDGGTVCRSVTRAKALLGKRAAGTADRIFIPLLSGHRERLCCTISNMQKQVFPSSPADLFIFSANNSARAFAQHRCPGKSKKANVLFMARDEHWVTPPQAGDSSGWRTTKSEGYRQMGNWRLLFQFEFADRLGYRYLWQTDDDSRLLRPLKFDLVAHMRGQGLLMASKKTQHDPTSVTTGLPELTAYFLLNEGLEPEMLYSHCSPRSREGLITQGPKRRGGGTRQGWDRTILYGNCVVVDVRFWLQPAVQRYIQLVVGTGAHFRLRWQEQAVQAMVWQIFVPLGNFSLLPIDQAHPSRVC